MSTTLVSNIEFKGDVARLPSLSAPMPKSALAYADFINGVYIDRIGGVVNRSDNINARVNLFRGSHANYIADDGTLAEALNSVNIIDRHPRTLKKLGLRVEGEVTNYASNPVDFTAAAWAKTGVSVIAGENHWHTLAEDAATSQHGIRDTTTQLATTSANVISVYVKAGTAGRVQLAANGGGAEAYANFDLVNGAVLLLGTGLTTALIEPGYNGSWRCSIVLTNPASATADVRISFISADKDAMSPSFAGTGRTLQIAIAQAERAMIAPTSPITFGTRSADISTFLPDIPAASQSNFALFISGTMPASPRGDDGGNNIVTLYNATAGKFISIGQGSRRGSYPYAPLATHNIGGTFTPVPFTGRGYQAHKPFAVLVSVSGNTVKIICNNSEVQTLLTTVTSGFEKVILGRGMNASLSSTGVWNAFISKTVMFDTALSDDDMVSQFSSLS
ncbi:phage head spike fiber domain-containing protein [Klebsiella quasipneumoniae]|uniref:phage head spike fiber domain-containing protein n=1 Tax=Klebsiella quasipneumoniae TaxID=1463165 RepID=UPI00388F773F|nr:hypothetical protein [Klebsiella quasipneumoniae subsp. quasipneumoniae]HBW1725723.1 hypothetical protein [Klebsiella quasipneumoniae subsp. quasipneumoniae]HBW1731649.1 hypothetical protein [Klebsiella quasipneumoniae subsp. quasipneumoniae]HBW1819088.1 hypothetical protein [Klebsiella quasipneumoniae subsp. quasipneumoniae]HCM4044865.1 hypothetical protein [Klebsiella quasipneumoniae subsp. quasipneumoniae]